MTLEKCNNKFGYYEIHILYLYTKYVVSWTYRYGNISILKRHTIKFDCIVLVVRRVIKIKIKYNIKYVFVFQIPLKNV